MRLCIISRWNASCGVSLHAELLGREFIKRGYDVRVIAPTLESANKDWHHIILNVKDEEWVYRCYEESSDGYGIVDERCVESLRCESILVEFYGRIPYVSLGKLLRKLHRDSRIIVIVHSTTIDEIKGLVMMPYDFIVVFDRRYIDELLNRINVSQESIKIIPYPCVEEVNAKPYRPDFAHNKILFFSFGRQPSNEYKDFIKALSKLRSKYDLVYWIVRSSDELRDLNYDWIKQWRQRLSLKEVFSYLKGSDIHLLPKSKGYEGKVVISSTVYQTIASLTPIVTLDGKYVETIPTNENGIGAIVKYRNVNDLIRKLTLLIEDNELRNYVVSKAKEFVEKYKVSKIADIYAKLIR